MGGSRCVAARSGRRSVAGLGRVVARVAENPFVADAGLRVGHRCRVAGASYRCAVVAPRTACERAVFRRAASAERVGERRSASAYRVGLRRVAVLLGRAGSG